MHNCQSLDPLVTPYVDGELADAERHAVEAHLIACPPCHSRVTAERAVHDLLRARKPTLCKPDAPDALHARCSSLAQRTAAERTDSRTSPSDRRPAVSEARTPHAAFEAAQRGASVSNGVPRARRARYVPYALAASLAAVVGGAFVYQATDK